MTNPDETKYRPWTPAEAIGKTLVYPDGDFYLITSAGHGKPGHSKDKACSGSLEWFLDDLAEPDHMLRQPDGTPCGVALEPEPIAMRACRCGGLVTLENKSPQCRVACPRCGSSSAWWTTAAKAAEDWSRLAPFVAPAPGEQGMRSWTSPPVRWNLVADRLPPDDHDVLVANGFQIVAFRSLEGWHSGPSAVQICGVTHWRELPEYPGKGDA